MAAAAVLRRSAGGAPPPLRNLAAVILRDPTSSALEPCYPYQYLPKTFPDEPIAAYQLKLPSLSLLPHSRSTLSAGSDDGSSKFPPFGVCYPDFPFLLHPNPVSGGGPAASEGGDGDGDGESTMWADSVKKKRKRKMNKHKYRKLRKLLRRKT